MPIKIEKAFWKSCYLTLTFSIVLSGILCPKPIESFQFSNGGQNFISDNRLTESDLNKA